jgi:hypothetical protein
MTTNTITDIINSVALSPDSATAPSYTIGTGTSPWSGSNVTWASPSTWTSGSATIATNLTVKPSGSISVKGEDADIDINGKSMKAWMEKVEERLNLLCVNPELESDWEELREIGNQYRALEQRIKSKMTTWKKLQADDQSNC